MTASKPCCKLTPSERQSVQTNTWRSSCAKASIFILRSSSAKRLVTTPTTTFLNFLLLASWSVMYLPTYSAVWIYWQNTIGFMPLSRENFTISRACFTFSSPSVSLMCSNCLMKLWNSFLSVALVVSNASGTTSSAFNKSFRGSLNIYTCSDSSSVFADDESSLLSILFCNMLIPASGLDITPRIKARRSQ